MIFKVSMYGSIIMFLATAAFLLGYSNRSEHFTLQAPDYESTEEGKNDDVAISDQKSVRLSPAPLKETVQFFEIKDGAIEQFDEFTHIGNLEETLVGRDDILYFSDSDASLNSYNFRTKKLNELIDFPSERIVSLKKSFNEGYIWLTTASDNERLRLHELAILTNSVNTVEKTFDPVRNGSIYRIDSKGNDLIAIQGGGDGCGGYGKIIALKNNLLSELYEVGSGCAEEPRLVASSQNLNLIVLANPDKETITTAETSGEEHIISLMFFDPFANSIVGEKDFSNGPFTSPYEVLMSPDEKRIALFATDAVHILDLNSKEFTAKIPLPRHLTERFMLIDRSSGVWGDDDKLYWVFEKVNKNPGNISILNTVTSEAIEIEVENEKYNNQTYTPLGFIDGRMVFYFKRRG